MNNENRGKIRRLFAAGLIILCTFVFAIVAKAATNNTSNKSAAVPGITVPRELEQFIKYQAVDSGMNFIRLKEQIKKDQLPLLYKLLADATYAPYWHNIARMIGYISDDPNSIPVLLTYFQRNDRSMVESISGKIYSIALIGKIGGEKADSILKKAITKEGVEELAKLWINEGKWKNSDKITKDRVITSTQGAAFTGLVFSGKKENWDLVEKLYNEQKEISLKSGKQTDIMSALVDAMVTKALITDDNNDVESYFRIDSQVKFQALKPYLDKYSLRNVSNR
ncbi:MAG: hypothetical protein JW787_15015 [Sedimentisphaerales bacterium]|nr:hypothetical protein [Sedimentisphaerales bacterium]